MRKHLHQLEQLHVLAEIIRRLLLLLEAHSRRGVEQLLWRTWKYRALGRLLGEREVSHRRHPSGHAFLDFREDGNKIRLQVSLDDFILLLLQLLKILSMRIGNAGLGGMFRALCCRHRGIQEGIDRLLPFNDLDGLGRCSHLASLSALRICTLQTL